MRICFAFASRSRPQRFFDCLDNIRDFSESKDYFVWAKLDEDDLFADMYRVRLHEYPELTAKWGFSEGKVSAINRSMEDLPPCDIIVMQSDDIQWDVYGFDNEIREAFRKHYPDLDGTIHWPEFNAQQRTIIVSILGINLYKALGYLYHPDFSSVYCDNHFTELTRLMSKYVFVDKILFSHLHPIWGSVDWDDQYRHSERPEVYQKDHTTFERHKNNNFYL